MADIGDGHRKELVKTGDWDSSCVDLLGLRRRPVEIEDSGVHR